ncbi:Transient Receptor Potential Channel Fragment [Ectocarpus siliculosus]|uniref:Transient Receptor Potential Channel n=1 Tax=Ectocarpus siliculosus TaxID=2880 RepID=D7G2W7_ECTSI|nr:Transient Receptor Potential Channel Fragment [Ectocarpus siliculosus]
MRPFEKRPQSKSRLEANPSRREDQGLVYSITTDIGVFNSGLNFNLCGMLAILGGPDVMTDAVRSVSLRFNTYNGQCDGLFSFVDITALFTLGGEVKMVTSVEVFSMPFFFGSSPAIVGRAIAMFAFGLMLVIYIGKDVLRAWREVRDGRHRLSMSLRHVPVTTATALNLVGDCVFLWNLVLWVNVAVTAAKFELIPTLSYNNASEQVRAFSEELALVALERWKRDAAAVAGSIFGLTRLFIMLRFHPRLSLVTDVLTASAVHLVHFFIMFFMVVGVYSNLVWVIFGPSSLLFATWTKSFVTMTRIALGEFDNIYPLMVEIDGAAAFMIIVTYQTLQCILLLNIVISILLDAFQMVQKRNSVVAADTLWQTVMTTLGRWRIRLTHVGFALVGRCPSVTRRSSPRGSSVGDDAGTTVVKNPMHDRHGGRKLRQRHQHTAPTAGGTSAAAVAAAAGVPVAPPGITGSSSRGVPLLPSSDKRKVSSKNRGGGATKRGGLTRGQRLAMSHRHYDLRTAVEVLRRSPLPEAAVWRKMRQIIGARLGWVSEGAGNTGKPLQPGAAWGRSQSRRFSKR